MLTEELANDTGVEVDFQSLVAELDASVSSQTGEPAAAAPAGKSAAHSAVLAVSDDNLKELQEQLDTGRVAYRITAKIAEGSAFAAVRFFQLHAELGECGKIITSAPSETDIQEERVSDTYVALVGSDLQPPDIEARLSQVEEIASVSVEPYDASAEARPEPEHAAEAHERAGGEGDHKAAVAQTVRIDVERLDHLMNLIGELVIDRTRIQQIGRSLLSRYEHDDLVGSLGKTSAHIVKVVDDLQEDFMKVRMLPISTVFNSFPRMMRDLSRKLGKPIDFQISGGGTEIDRTVIERIRDPLVHMLRNALDHGLESPEDRVKSGKDESGLIQLAAYHEQGHIVIKVKDDGAGMDPQKLRDTSSRRASSAARRPTGSQT